MNQQITPTSIELSMRDEDFIVSMIDTSGNLTYANRVFIEMSGYVEEEVLGASYTLFRHPDMPRAISKLVWDKLSNKEECFYYSKDMARSGSYCWTFANVTPTFDPSGNVLGYISVRRKPKPASVQAISEIYRTMLDAEKRAGEASAVAASTRILNDLLQQKGLSYDEFVLAI